MTQRPVSSSDNTSTAASPEASIDAALQTPSHELECLIQRRLQTQPGLKFGRLTVHKCSQRVYLEGLLETNEDGIDLCELVNQFAGVTAINRVVMRSAMPK